MASKQDGILGIENRTENWKTAGCFASLTDHNKFALAKKLVKPYKLADDGIKISDVKIELFWRGMRDCVYAKGECESDLMERAAAIYCGLFANHDPNLGAVKLRDQISDFRSFRPLNPDNYKVSCKTKESFFGNLKNTEIDIVLETSKYLFIGEAKHESRFGADGKLILVHQLIRQYVTARVLIDLKQKGKQVVPFVVADPRKLDSERSAQVQFMVSQGWLKNENVLSWCDIDTIKQDPLR